MYTASIGSEVDDALDRRHDFVDELLTPPPPPRPSPTANPAPRFHHRPALRKTPPSRGFSRRSALREGGATMSVVRGLYRYPIKGLSPQPVPGIELEAGKPFPHDRIFAFARPGSPIDPEAPTWAKKGLFVMLMLDEELARVRTHLDADTLAFTVHEGNRQVLPANLTDPQQVAEVEALFHRLVPKLRAAPRLVGAQHGHFMDKPDNVLSLINLATVRSLEERWGYLIDPLRFRANFYIDGTGPWEEFDWIGADISIGDAAFRVDRRNGRCGATNVNPASGQRDLDLPGSLRASFGHKDLGVYLVVRHGGKVVIGDGVTVPHGVGVSSADPAPVAAIAGSDQRRFICRGCYFIYEEAEGLPQAGIKPSTSFIGCFAARANILLDTHEARVSGDRRVPALVA